MLSAISRDGVAWVQTSPGAEHYSARWDNGHLLLHANRNCCHVEDPVVVSPKIVKTLWDKDVAASATADENGVEWCEVCATRRVG